MLVHALFMLVHPCSLYVPHPANALITLGRFNPYAPTAGYHAPIVALACRARS